MREIMYWNDRSYGSALRIRKGTLRLVALGICLATPFTNVCIPFLRKIFSSDLVIRYG